MQNVIKQYSSIQRKWSEAITPMTDWELSERTIRSSSFTLISSNRILFQNFQFHWFNRWQTKPGVKPRVSPRHVSWATLTGLCKPPHHLHTKQSSYVSRGRGIVGHGPGTRPEKRAMPPSGARLNFTIRRPTGINPKKLRITTSRERWTRQLSK